MLTVLIADDEPHLRLLVSATLASSELRLVEASDGDQAWRLLSAERPDVAVLDVMMPGKTGLELVKLIRADEALRAMRVILLTAKNQPEDVQAGRQAGADLYLTKPFSPLTLLNAVTCDFAMAAAGHEGTSEHGGLHVHALSAPGGERHWRPALTVNAETGAPAQPPPPAAPPRTPLASGPRWPSEFVDERRLWELLGYADAAAVADPAVAARVASLQRRLADASAAGRIKRFVARDPAEGNVVARGYRREDVQRLFGGAARAQAHGVAS